MKELIGICLIWFMIITITISLTFKGKAKEKIGAILVATLMMVLLSVGVYIAFG